MNEIIQQLYDKFCQEITIYLNEHSIYSPVLYKKEVENKIFPKVIAKELPRTSEYDDLKYSAEKYYYGIEFNVYAIQNGDIANSTIADEIANHIETFFKEFYHMTVKVSKNVANVDKSVYRNIIQATCVIDTKYKDKLLIYPK